MPTNQDKAVRVIVPSFAKLNLDLRILHKRTDGFHELRTIFQTISLRDDLTVEWEAARQTRVELASSVEIPDNIVVRAARLLLERVRTNGVARFTLRKRIPMGAGMGGGSSNAATALLALNSLLKKRLPVQDLIGLAEQLGSDVPFFLRGGTALGLGRGTELYPLPDQPSHPILVLATGIHVSTAEAYRGLNRPVNQTLTQSGDSPILGEFQTTLKEFQTTAWALDRVPLLDLPLQNDFEESVFALHPQLGQMVRKLKRLGARPALMTGSGSALFGVFPTMNAARAAATAFPVNIAHSVRLLTRRQYARKWEQALRLSAGTGPLEV